MERGVRVVQILHRGWDQHGSLPAQIKNQCMDTDQPTAALMKDLKQRGLLDDTLVVFGGEFGRTVYCWANSRARIMGGTITHVISACGLPVLVSKPGSLTVPPMILATTSPTIPCTSMS